MDYLRRGQLKYITPQVLSKPSLEQTLAKKQLSKFFTDEMEQTGRYFYEMNEESEDYTVYETDRLHKRKIVKPELSIAKYACSTSNKKLFFGSPNSLLLIEDLAYRLSLKELQDMFDECV